MGKDEERPHLTSRLYCVLAVEELILDPWSDGGGKNRIFVN